jgi:manganese/zinc/iron transport system permease protein
MMGISVLISILISILGYYLAVAIDGSIAGAIVSVAGVGFMLAFLFSPRQGVLRSRKKGAVKWSEVS